MKKFLIDTLLVEFDELIKGYDFTDTCFLDTEGNWQTIPITIRDKISNQLLYRLWVNKYKEGGNLFFSLVNAVIFDNESWDIIEQIILLLKVKKIFILLEFIYQVVELEVNRINGDKYVPEWNYEARREKDENRQKAKMQLDKWNAIIKNQYHIDMLLQMIENLRKINIMKETSVIISEEKKINKHIEMLLRNFSDVKNREMAYAALNDELSYSFSENINCNEALLFPCIKLLNDVSIPISSGLPYETVVKLGMLRDSRATACLLNALDRISWQHVDIYAGIIYALGNLRQKKAIEKLRSCIHLPDFMEIESANGLFKYKLSLNKIKAESAWALGKLGANSIDILPDLCNTISSSDIEVKLAVAWALGKIGKEQFEEYGGLSIELVIALLKLLADNSINVFEEAAYALKNIGLSEYLNLLHLHNVSAFSVLTLKPSSLGLAELSETLMYLLNLRKPIVMAVTGDSGTGKTYFCESIIKGFGSVLAKEILYLARDKIEHNNIFNRILGLKWLKKHVSPQFYLDYPLKEEEDNPKEYFQQFIKENADKKLIILDGWRDYGYFHQVIQIFYENGYLDIIVKFKTTFSTKRKNLEEREKIIDNVRICLGNIEEPIIEETPIYREGKVLLYYLDNSEVSRLNKEETLEIFEKTKVQSWGDFIRIGEFVKDLKSLIINEDSISLSEEEIKYFEESLECYDSKSIIVKEAKFYRKLNDNIGVEPNLLQIIDLSNYYVNKISFYLPGRLAFGSKNGDVGNLLSVNDRVFSAHIHSNEVVDIGIIGEDLISLDSNGIIKITSFITKSVSAIANIEEKICSISTDRRNKIIAGSIDGAVYILDFGAKKKIKLLLNDEPVLFANICQNDLLIICNNNTVRILKIKQNKAEVIEEKDFIITALALSNRNEIILGLKDQSNGLCSIKMINLENYQCRVIELRDIEIINAVNVYFDGRLIVGAKSKENKRANLFIIDVQPNECWVKELSGHEKGIYSCITMGPRIITYGINQYSNPELKIWGTESYVKVEHGKLKLTEGTGKKPPYYWTIF